MPNQTPLALVVLAAGLGTRFGGLKQLAPVGPDGEAIMDYAALDATEAGYSPIVLIVREEIRETIATHVRARWPANLAVEYAVQDRPLGTAHALLAARRHLGGPFAVVNADDLYPLSAYRALHEHLTDGDGTHALAGFRVADTILGPRRVSRALCRVDGDKLVRIDEGKVDVGEDGTLRWTDGNAVVELGGDEPVSMNCFGFQPRVVDVMSDAVERFLADDPPDDAEVLLPGVLGEHLEDPGGAVTVVPGGGRCLGVTHADDVPLLQAELASRKR